MKVNLGSYCFVLNIGIFYLLLFTRTVTASEDQARLIRDLFRNYNSLLRPVQFVNQTVNVTFAMTLGLLIYVNERQQVMKTNGYTVLEWTDPQLIWDIGDYGGITAIRVPEHKVWTPDIVLLTNTDGKFGPSYRANAVIYNVGTVNWMPPFIYKSSCQIKVDYFPFDQQECIMRFSSWTYNSLEVDVHPRQVVVDVTNYLRGGIWDLVDARINRVAYEIGGYASKETTPRVDILVTIVIRRKTLFYTINLLIPTVLISFMTVFVFLLPTVAGEKITLTISLTLTIVVFLLLVSKILPPAETMPLISKFLLFIFVMNLVSVFVTVITINLNYRGPKTHNMPACVRVVFLHFFPRILLMKRPLARARRRSNMPPNRSNAQSSQNIRNPTTSTPTSMRNLASYKDVFSNHSGEVPVIHDNTPSFEQQQLNPDQNIVEESVDYIASYMERNNEIKLVEEDWKYLALVVDRILLWVFFWGTCAGSMSILLNSGHIFTNVDEAETVRRLTAQLR